MGSERDLVLVGRTAARRRVRQTRDWTRAKEARFLVAEANNGGEMVRGVIEGCGASRGMVRLVHASRGKSARAEPVALRFEAGRAWFGGRFLALEDQLAGLCAGGGYDGPGRSPDRADALVWAMVELAVSRTGVPRVLRL